MRHKISLFFIFIFIPFYNVKSEEAFYPEGNFFSQTPNKPLQTILLLPFSSGARMVEYYEGFLLALEDIKKKGISVNLQVFDIGQDTKKLPDIFAELYWTDLDVVIGGLSEQQIKLISEFCKKKNTPYVIPFTSKSDETSNNRSVYQINTPQTHLYKKVAQAFSQRYKNDNILFHAPVGKGNKTDFVQVLQSELKSKSIAYQVIDTTELSENALAHYLKKDKNNVLLPSGDSSDALLKLTIPLKSIKQNTPEIGVSLFGHPSWQIYSSEFTDDFFRFNALFYSVFYADPLSPKVKTFRNNYHKWFSKELMNTFPKYGLLGYDTGMYFLLTLANQKTAFSGLQTDFYFERVNAQSGFINTNLYLIEYHTDYSVTSEQKK
ncbi:MAG: ABC transporter substrate-binding protein [Dysgonamonadaceae bacterium]|jgi:hypothetical protein|nr:ABC transporter substrate-binding protein [Dysgonamonadaceae bacterium]